MRKVTGFLIFILLVFSVYPCTIGVASGKATADGRPLIWKNRDSAGFMNYVEYFKGKFYDYIAVINRGAKNEIYAGVNEAGFAILNSLAYDLQSSGMENGDFMKLALETCRTVSDFERLLDKTVGARKVSANFAVIDAKGGAVLFEVGEKFHRKFDANETKEGYILRTNFTVTGGGDTGIERFNRQLKLIKGQRISVEFLLQKVLRDVTDLDGEVYSPATGKEFFEIKNSICRDSTTSAVVIQGVKDEPPFLSTMWVIPSNPLTGPAVPLWVYSGRVPAVLEGNGSALLNEEMTRISRKIFDFKERKLRVKLLPLFVKEVLEYEREIFSRVRASLISWRKNLPPARAVDKFSSAIAEEVLQFVRRTRLKIDYAELASKIKIKSIGRGKMRAACGLAFDGSRYLYLSDPLSNAIYRYDLKKGKLKLYAGGRGAGLKDGSLKKALFNEPCWMAFLEKGKLAVVDRGNNAIRVIDVASKKVSTLPLKLKQQIEFILPYRRGSYLVSAGKVFLTFNPKRGRPSRIAGGKTGFLDSAGSDARIGLAAAGIRSSWEGVYFVDALNHAVRLLTPASVVITVAGTGKAGWKDGALKAALFNAPSAITLDPAGRLWVIDRGSGKLRVILPEGFVFTVLDLKEAGITQPQHLLFVKPDKLFVTSRRGQVFTFDISLPSAF